jgi:hypothetical protein
MRICENCSEKHDGNYGSGRFCSNKCSRCFSTKAKRTEINEKISKKLKKEDPVFILECQVCKTTFTFHRQKKTCSSVCSKIVQIGVTKKGNYKENGGLRNGGGKSKQLPYTNWLNQEMKLNAEEIDVAKILDSLKLNWKRNSLGFKYLTEEGKQRKFYPDFYIKDLDLFLEYKGWLTNEMRHKMKDCLNRNNIKLLIVVGSDIRYFDDGIKIHDLKNYLQTGVAQ